MNISHGLFSRTIISPDLICKSLRFFELFFFDWVNVYRVIFIPSIPITNLFFSMSKYKICSIRDLTHNPNDQQGKICKTWRMKQTIPSLLVLGHAFQGLTSWFTLLFKHWKILVTGFYMIILITNHWDCIHGSFIFVCLQSSKIPLTFTIRMTSTGY